MTVRARRSLFLVSLLLPGSIPCLNAQSATSNPVYQQLRNGLPSNEVLTVSKLELRRDAAVLTLRSGSVALYGSVNGRVTGAVFRGDGHLHITPPIAAERHNLRILTHAEEFDEDFDQAVLRFTDGTAAEVRSAAAGRGSPDGSFNHAAQELDGFLRHQLHENVDLRLLEDVLSPSPGGYFLAAIHGRRNPHLFFELDPHGVPGLAPEEVALLNWTEEVPTFPLAFHRSAEYAAGTAGGNEHNAAYTIASEDLDVSIEKSGFLSSLARIALRADQEGVAVIPLSLYPTLRVSGAEDGGGQHLDVIQERREDDPDLGIVLAHPLRKGETVTLQIAYGGRDVVLNRGAGNYYPVARENWYPNSDQGLGDYASYTMQFHVPRGLELVATGNRTGTTTDGRITTTAWKTPVPLPVVGFSLGDFAERESQFGKALEGQFTVTAYANRQPPDEVRSIAEGGGLPVGTLASTPMLAMELSQGEAAARLYTSLFGSLSFDHISLTQQSACNYGQSWPMLVYLPICGFFDDTQRHALGIGGESLGAQHNYWEVVTPHEVAHQWWGQTVGFRSYRDQWMSEGFADASASIFLEATQPKEDRFLDFWRQERRLLTEKNQFGFRPVDVGPVTMGVRLSSPRTGWNVYPSLVYPKGAYILHMIRMMMRSAREGDRPFEAMMHDFLDSHRMQAATTEDFKAAVERHMVPAMDLDGNHRMDWFFNQFVYGTDLPAYHFEGDVRPNGEGANLHIKLTQSGVGPAFRMLVPVYLEFTDGKVTRLGAVKMIGSTTEDRTIPLPKLPGSVRRVSINHYYDVLSTED